MRQGSEARQALHEAFGMRGVGGQARVEPDREDRRRTPVVDVGRREKAQSAPMTTSTITLERAKELIAKPKGQRRQRAAATELKALGPHPTGGAPVRILDGRYGPYVTDGTTNASLPKGTAPESLTMAQAVELMNARASLPSSKKRGPIRGAGGRGRGAAKSAPKMVPRSAAKPAPKSAAPKRTKKT